MVFAGRRWGSLSSSLDEAVNPIRLGIDGLLVGDVAGLQADYRDAHGPMLVAGSGANPGTIGGAFDLALRFLIEAAPSLAMARRAAAHLSDPGADLEQRGSSREPVVALVDELCHRLGLPLAQVHRTPASAPVAIPMQVPDRDSEALIRASWALTLFTEVFRAGPFPGSPLVQYLNDTETPTADGLLDLAPRGAIDELTALLDLAQDRLLSPLKDTAGPWHIGPVFAGSRLMAADTDLIAGGVLVEIKTTLGARRPDGTRRARLTREHLRQLIGYALHDLDNDYQLHSVGIYEARYGTLTVWPLGQLFERVAGRPVDLAAERERHRQLLMSPPLS